MPAMQPACSVGLETIIMLKADALCGSPIGTAAMRQTDIARSLGLPMAYATSLKAPFSSRGSACAALCASAEATGSKAA
jgi:hypothetical protein